jgi:hypothetical protein
MMVTGLFVVISETLFLQLTAECKARPIYIGFFIMLEEDNLAKEKRISSISVFQQLN